MSLPGSEQGSSSVQEHGQMPFPTTEQEGPVQGQAEGEMIVRAQSRACMHTRACLWMWAFLFSSHPSLA